MSINFHDHSNKYTYAQRDTNAAWKTFITQYVDATDKVVADIGCGGGIYSIAWAQLGAKQVIGIDFSKEMVAAASEKAQEFKQIHFQQGRSDASGLPDQSVDIVFEKALIHHLSEYEPTFLEAKRILKSGGYYLIQDRTVEDVSLAGSTEHLRGYFFEAFPRLLDIEKGRRPNQQRVIDQLQQQGFTHIQSVSFWEIRKIYEQLSQLQQDLSNRTGRSILHELSDAELQHLVDVISDQLKNQTPIQEQDRWTLWVAQKA